MLTILTGLLLLSVSAGLVGSLSGLGGGVFIVPALIVVFHLPIKVAIGASLISVVATGAGASVAFVRDSWTNLRVAMVLECTTVTGAITGAYLAGIAPPHALELLFAAIMLQSAYFSLNKPGDDIIPESDALCRRLRLHGVLPGDDEGSVVPYGVVNLPGGAGVMVGAGLMSGLLAIGAGALKVIVMDRVMHLPLKVSSATSNFMIGVDAGAGALVFLARGDVATVIAAPVALGVAAGALAGSRLLPYANVRALRIGFVIILAGCGKTNTEGSGVMPDLSTLRERWLPSLIFSPSGRDKREGAGCGKSIFPQPASLDRAGEGLTRARQALAKGLRRQPCL